jgi:DNA-binding Lrp family transcriptional regulator
MRKDLPQKLLRELLKNSKQSDRGLAKILKVSQPTITRTRHKLEKDAIEGYTIIPNWPKTDFKIFAFTFIKSKFKYGSVEKREAAIQKAREWLLKQPNVIFSAGGEGIGWDALTLSIHKSYSCYTKFKRKHDTELGDTIDASQTFVVNLEGTIPKPLHLKYLADTK